MICDAVAFVETTRGRGFKAFPNVQVMADADFDADLLEAFEQEAAELEAADVTLSALGLLEADVSYVELFREALEVGVVGRYDLETEQLILRGDELSLHVQNVLVHELTHALDDQWFDIDREFDDDEAAYGFIAVVEGNASRVDDEWASELDPDDQALLARQELATLAPGDLQRLLAIPFVVIQLQTSPYQDGSVFIDALLASGGEAAVDEALTTPPTSSEEILHPLVDRGADPEIEVAAPPAGGEIVADGRLGELIIRLWLGRVAGEGWGGDSFVAWTANGQNCLTADIAADSERDLDDLRSAGEVWVAERPQARSITTVGSNSDLVRISGCQ